MAKVGIVGLAAAAAAAIAAVALSASPAMAATGDTVLCRVAAAPCPIASQYTTGTELNAPLKPGTKLVFASSAETVSCATAELEVTTNAQSGAPLQAQLRAFPIGQCTDQSADSCGVSVGGLPAPAALAASSPGDGTLTLDDLSFAINCGGPFDCTFAAPSSGLVGALTGGNPATIQFSNALLNGSGGPLCPSEATLSATFQTIPSAGGGLWLERSA